MRTALGLLGTAFVVTGVIWIFQGSGFLKGSFMTGSTLWLWMGVVAVSVGVPLAAAGFRKTPGQRGE
jgi:hypothetical protein